MSIETVLLIVIVTFGFASLLNRWDMRLKRRGQEKKELKLTVFGPLKCAGTTSTGLSWAQEHPAHGAPHRAGAGSV
jgi:hypothetical protein